MLRSGALDLTVLLDDWPGNGPGGDKPGIDKTFPGHGDGSSARRLPIAAHVSFASNGDVHRDAIRDPRCITPRFSGGAMPCAARRERIMKWSARVVAAMSFDRPLQPNISVTHHAADRSSAASSRRQPNKDTVRY